MRRVLVFGNSGSGKTTLSNKICSEEDIPHLDLDVLAWQETVPPKRKPIEESIKAIEKFMDLNDDWVIEGCYSDLLEIALPEANEIIFMNLPLNLCITNAKKRPWEPHKYKSKEEQDSNLEMLVNWISQYETREDTFSKKAHLALYESFLGKKSEYITNERNI